MSKSKHYDVSVFDRTSFGQALAVYTDYVDYDSFVADDVIAQLSPTAKRAVKAKLAKSVNFVDYDTFND